MRKYLLLGVLILQGFLILPAQNKDGDYYYKLKTYDRAIKAYSRELKKDKENEKLLLKMVDCYLNANLDRSLAIPYAEKLVEKEASVLNVLNYGKSLFYDRNFSLALKQFELVQEKTSAGDELYKLAQQYRNWLINAQAYINKPHNVSFINLGRKINTSKSELNPMVDGADRLLMYSNNKRYHSSVGVHYYNICVSENKNLKWLKTKTIGSAINSGYDEIVSGLTADGKKLFVYHNRDWVEQIGFSNYSGNYKFSRLAPFDEGWDKKKGTFGVWQSNSQDTLLFVGETERGNTDIYYALKLPNGELGESRPVPGGINTEWEENFPVLTRGGTRLYFSSNGGASMGGYDLFYSDWNKDKKEWGTPISLGYPINDVYDNYTISYTNDQCYAYVSAIRPEGFGERDVYKVICNEQSSTNLILKCKTYLQTDSGKIAPPFRLRTELNDSISGALIGKYTLSSDSANFIIALNPGKYMLNYYTKDSLLSAFPIFVPEVSYDNIPLKMDFVLPKSDVLLIKENK